MNYPLILIAVVAAVLLPSVSSVDEITLDGDDWLAYDQHQRGFRMAYLVQ